MNSGRKIVLHMKGHKSHLSSDDPDLNGKTKQSKCIYEIHLPFCARNSRESLLASLHWDPLTGIPGRSLFERLAREVILPHGSNEPPTPSTFVVLDINQFKVVNESMGYSGGDHLLNKVTSRIGEYLRNTDILARWGGDRFAILLRGVDSETDASSTMQRLLESLCEPFCVSGNRIHITACAGLSLFPRDGAAPDILMYAAENALNHAKTSGQGKVCFYRDEFSKTNRRRYELSADLRRGITAKEFFLLYQPQVDAHTSQPIGLEALVRWNHPVKGVIPPSDFISIAEDIGAIEDLGTEIFRMACAQIQAWREVGDFSLRVGVNISPRQLRSDLPKFMANTIERYSIPASLIEVELTESSIQLTPEIITVMEEIRAIGVSIAIDDFGTGYSSLAHLNHFNFNRLKIDKSFVDGIPNNCGDNAIIKAIISLGIALGTNIVVEGVENKAQAEFLRNEGANVLQGFLFNRPLKAQDVISVLSINSKKSANHQSPSDSPAD